MNICEAIEALKNGKAIKHKSWDGYVYMVHGRVLSSNNTVYPHVIFERTEDYDGYEEVFENGFYSGKYCYYIHRDGEWFLFNLKSKKGEPCDQPEEFELIERGWFYEPYITIDINEVPF